jgi:hypothetical protein
MIRHSSHLGCGNSASHEAFWAKRGRKPQSGRCRSAACLAEDCRADYGFSIEAARAQRGTQQREQRREPAHPKIEPNVFFALRKANSRPRALAISPRKIRRHEQHFEHKDRALATASGSAGRTRWPFDGTIVSAIRAAFWQPTGHHSTSSVTSWSSAGATSVVA